MAAEFLRQEPRWQESNWLQAEIIGCSLTNCKKENLLINHEYNLDTFDGESNEEDAELGSLAIIDDELEDKQPEYENLEGEREADLPLDGFC